MGLDNSIEHWSLKPGALITKLGRVYSLDYSNEDKYIHLLHPLAKDLQENMRKAIQEKSIPITNNPTINVNSINMSNKSSNETNDTISLNTNIIGYADYIIASYIFGRVIGNHYQNKIAPLAMTVTVQEDETYKLPIELQKIDTLEGAGKTSIIGGAISPKIGLDPKLTVYDRLRKKLGIPKEAIKSLVLTGAGIDRTCNYLELYYLTKVDKGSINIPEERKMSVSMILPEDMIKLVEKGPNKWVASVYYSIISTLSQKQFFGERKMIEIMKKGEEKLKIEPFQHTYAIEELRKREISL